MKYLALTMAMVRNTLADGSISITENGAEKSMFILDAGTKGQRSTTSGNQLTIPHNGRSYLAVRDRAGSSLDPHGWYIPNLVGGSIEFDVNLSQAGCSCNAALYLVSMPGYNANQDEDPSSGGDYYCDANNVGGVWCPEMDIMEANSYAWHTTPHHCDAPQGKHYTNCDRGGAGKSIHSQDPNAYGPGSQYKINTQNQFHVKQDFNEKDGKVSSIVTTFTQDSNEYVLTVDDPYVESMTDALKAGMTVAISNWGSSWSRMSWLDQDTGCTGDCNNDPNVMWSNIKYTLAETPTPPSPGTYKWSCNTAGDCLQKENGDFDSEDSCKSQCAAPPTPDWDYGQPCSTTHDGLCGDNCSECDWSWPHGSDWSDKDANCRCKTPRSSEETFIQ